MMMMERDDDDDDDVYGDPRYINESNRIESKQSATSMSKGSRSPYV
jgi:hypothetical protein